MSRFSWWFVLAGLAALVTVAPALAQEGKPGFGPEAMSGPPGSGMGGWSPLFGLPGYSMLGAENVQKELELVDEQKRKLHEIAEQYRKQTQEGWREEWEKIRKLPPDEQRKHLAQQREKTAKRTAQAAAEARKKVEEVLLPHQRTRFQEIVFRTRATAILYNPKTLERLGLSHDQKERLRKVREELREKMQKLQQEAIDKTLGVLTPQQQATLKEMSSQGPGSSERPR